MVLVSQEIANRNIVHNAVAAGIRPTTYDATVGCIIQQGQEINRTTFQLLPRGVVWVISAETFEVPDNTTGLATLRTTWTHNGLLALNVGIVDPGWNGPLAAAVVNFSQDTFVIAKGDGFMRVVFHEHDPAGAKPVAKTHDEYKLDILRKSIKFSPTFLHMDKLVAEVSDQVFTLPRWGQKIAVAGFVIALLAIFVPIAMSSWPYYFTIPAQVETLQRQVSDLERATKGSDGSAELRRRVADLENALARRQVNNPPTLIPPVQAPPLPR